MNQNVIQNQILEERRKIRAKERAFRRSFNRINSKLFNKENEMDLSTKLKQVLPPHMVPGNVGNVNKVAWPFWYRIEFDFGVNPSWTPATRQVQSFQVTQEAAFLLMAIARKPWDSTTAGDRAPLLIQFVDRQSSRQFNDRPIPIQNIGKRKDPTILSTPHLIMPNAFIDCTITSVLTSGTMANVGNGKHEFTFFGYRTRVKDAAQVMSTIFG